ncbi:uncharacterized protein LOC118204195 [Stegodyphus dumicola]|uniref:uncharacterized protein LOC118204195 n=1 Tax=Stegodyphus dumicola TaxID=202533 RepID=UPI0015A9BFCD|nr:uncharacterized protein LOC118204195 [Stegodyphus dumicola]
MCDKPTTSIGPTDFRATDKDQSDELNQNPLKTTRCGQNFTKLTSTEDNRRIVSLPRKLLVTSLPTNKIIAENRFHSLQKRLASSDVLKTQYDKCMLNYIEQKDVEVSSIDESNEKPVYYYLPHHAVRKKTQSETKWRIVFDASSHAPAMTFTERYLGSWPESSS